MGYRINFAARALASRRSQSIALVIPDVVDPFYARVIEGVDQVSLRRGYAFLLYVTHSNPRREKDAVDDAATQRYGGTILFRRHLPLTRLQSAVKEGTRIVLLTQYEPKLGIDSIRVDDVDGAFKATEYLISLGHRRIACLTGMRKQAETEDRLLGFSKAHQMAGLSVDPRLIWEGDFREVTGAQAVEYYVALEPEARPTAVFAFNDRMAIGLLKALQAKGLARPGRRSR